MDRFIESCIEVAPLFKIPKSFQDYDFLAAKMDKLLDVVASDSSSPLWDIIDVMADRIIAFDEEHFVFDD